MDKGLLKKLLMIICGFVVLLIIFMIAVTLIKNSSNKKISYQKIKDNAVEAAKKYYEKLDEKLEIGESTEVAISDLVSKKYMQDFSDKLEDDIKCDGKITIINSLNRINYFPILDCGKFYKDETLFEHIIGNSEIINSGDGLYDIYDRYIYRGENVNNYVSFDDKIWYIVDMEKDGTIRLLNSKKALEDSVVWDDRYNVSNETSVGYNDFEKSRIYSSFKELEKNNDILSEKAKMYVIGQKICFGSRGENDTNNSNSVECSKTLNDQLFSTLTVSDIITASIDGNCNSIKQYQCENYNYLANRNVSSFWTFNADNKNDYTAYASSNGIVYYKDTNSYYNIYVTIKLPSESLYLSGDGTAENPYKIKED